MPSTDRDFNGRSAPSPVGPTAAGISCRICNFWSARSENDLPPLSWIQCSLPDHHAAETYLNNYDLAGISDDLASFLDFFDQRRERMGERLRHILGVNPSTLNSPDAVTSD